MNKPFDAKILAKARKVAERYEIIMSYENGEWYGKGLEIPTVFGDGKTAEECIENTREALAAVVAHLLEQGEVFPSPASENKRTEQVNVRLTKEEKIILNTSARAQGFHGLADFLRAKAFAAPT
ncbi:MAG: type II toxin-antitoxin system HicB family antitoxin [Sedimentisphaerales bacterium]|nr:type II toxin-antitoxin system HicB family antitoxin [Sedimentisphaerales bacterium]